MLTQTYHISKEEFHQLSPGSADIISNNDKLSGGVFFDIETTGFSAEKNALYLMGCCRYDQGRLHLIQWMAENKTPDEQKAVLYAFLDYIRPYTLLISYNGTGFDLPFIEKKCQALGITSDFSRWEHMDLYKIIRPYKNFLKLDNLKLKTIEKFLGISREDMYSGGALIPIYEQFAKTGNSSLKQLLLLHNYEDIKDMLLILPVLAYDSFANGKFRCTKVRPYDVTEISNDTAHLAKHKNLPENHSVPALEIILEPFIPLPKHISCIYSDIFAGHSMYAVQGQLELFTHQIRLVVTGIHSELKFFYPDYKNYFYLPEEDCAIHRSIAEYVDKEHKKKAAPSTCYTKKAGDFLPQINDWFSPAFKINYKDTLTWFEYTHSFSDQPLFLLWIQSFLRFFIFGSF